MSEPIIVTDARARQGFRLVVDDGLRRMWSNPGWLAGGADATLEQARESLREVGDDTGPAARIEIDLLDIDGRVYHTRTLAPVSGESGAAPHAGALPFGFDVGVYTQAKNGVWARQDVVLAFPTPADTLRARARARRDEADRLDALAAHLETLPPDGPVAAAITALVKRGVG